MRLKGQSLFRDIHESKFAFKTLIESEKCTQFIFVGMNSIT